MARMYDPITARFMQEDTYRGQVNDPLSLNLYTYCHNEPLMYVDPSGHWDEDERNAAKGIYTSDDIALMDEYTANWNMYDFAMKDLQNDYRAGRINKQEYELKNSKLFAWREEEHNKADMLRGKYQGICYFTTDKREVPVYSSVKDIIEADANMDAETIIQDNAFYKGYFSILGDGVISTESYKQKLTNEYNLEQDSYIGKKQLGMTADAAIAYYLAGERIAFAAIEYNTPSPVSFKDLPSDKKVIESKQKLDAINKSMYKYLITNKQAREQFIENLTIIREKLEKQQRNRYDASYDNAIYKRNMLNYVDDVRYINVYYEESFQFIDAYLGQYNTNK